MDLGLKGRNAVVLGGTRGIGRAIAETLAREGSGVAVCARNADQVAATTNDVLEWRDEALMLNLASFGPNDHLLLLQADVSGLRDILGLSLEDFRDRIHRGAVELKREPPDDLTISGWWEQAKTLEEE